MGLQKKTIDALEGLTSTRVTREEFTVEVVDGPHQGKTLNLDKEIIRIGREDWCDISLPDDPWVSTVHCECLLEEQGLRVHDLHSRNGIRLNEIPVYDALFLPGTRLQVGQSTLMLRSSQKRTELDIHYYDSTGTLVGRSIAMRKIFSVLPRLAQRKVSTLLNGETGTGKTSIARAIHLHTHNENSKAPFVVVNCGALPGSLINAALFGHERGAFTGADKRHFGFFEQANGGTLFLDEIAELPLELQPKLLDVLERRMVRRLGSEAEHPVDFHLLAATLKDLTKECEAGRFREDLYFRLSIMELQVPPLRDRNEDIPLLVEAFLKELSPEQSMYVTSNAMQKLTSYLWPGNTRELRNALERALLFLDGNTIEPDDLDFEQHTQKPPSQRSERSLATRSSNLSLDEQRKWVEEAFPTLPLSEHEPPLSIKDVLQKAERFLIAQALQETDQNAPNAAKLLSMSESWLYNRIKLYGFTSKRKY